jgi:hypothetical protein
MTTDEQAPPLEWTPPHEVDVGQLVDVPIRTQNRMIVVRCLVLAERWAYGRVEYEVTPVEGSGATWVREDTFALDSTGARVVSPSEQNRRHNPKSRPRKPKMPKPSADVEPSLDDRIRQALEA